jgi:hypothetical protein
VVPPDSPCFTSPFRDGRSASVSSFLASTHSPRPPSAAPSRRDSGDAFVVAAVITPPARVRFSWRGPPPSVSFAGATLTPPQSEVGGGGDGGSGIGDFGSSNLAASPIDLAKVVNWGRFS